MSESDISKDYELTSFSSYGVRKRNDGGFPEAISFVRSLQGNTLQEQFATYLHLGGISDEEINALIQELIDQRTDV